MGSPQTLIFAIAVAAGGSLFAAEPDDALTKNVSLKIENQSLEFCLRDLVNLLKKDHPRFGLKILGNDLLLEGITRNQAIRDFEVKDQPLDEVLTALLVRANPLRGKAANDPDQKLLWVVGPDPADPDQRIILITTRAAAEKRGDKLPKAFQPVK